MMLFTKKIFSLFMAALSLVVSPIFGDFGGKFAPKSPEDTLLDFAVISDTHITESPLRGFMLELGLADMQNAASPLDALVISGDITDHGYVEHWEAAQKVFSKYTPAKNIILATGNHDTWTEKDTWGKAGELFIEYNEKITGNKIDNVYYSTKVNGYTFVVLGSEDDRTSAYFDDEELAWLDSTMAAAAQEDLPIFVICHQPINGTHGLPESWGDEDPEPDTGGIGDQSAQVEAILKKYDNVFLINGHLHIGFSGENDKGKYSYESIESDGSFHSVNLPCYTYFNIDGTRVSGTGFVFEVHEDEVVIRGRSFSGSVWYPNHEYVIPLA